MIGYAVAIRRKDGSLYLAMPNQGFATWVWFSHVDALRNARLRRDIGFDAVVVKVDYTEPTIVGPKRFAAPTSPTPEADHG